MRSPGNARKPKIWSVSLSQSHAKRRKINRPWPQSNQFWRWSGYISMQNFRPFPPCVLREMPGNLFGRTDGWTDGRTRRKTVTVGRIDQRTHVQVARGYFALRTDGRTDGQPENIMLPAPKGVGIKMPSTKCRTFLFRPQSAFVNNFRFGENFEMLISYDVPRNVVTLAMNYLESVSTAPIDRAATPPQHGQS